MKDRHEVRGRIGVLVALAVAAVVVTVRDRNPGRLLAQAGRGPRRGGGTTFRKWSRCSSRSRGGQSGRSRRRGRSGRRSTSRRRNTTPGRGRCWRPRFSSASGRVRRRTEDVEVYLNQARGGPNPGRVRGLRGASPTDEVAGRPLSARSSSGSNSPPSTSPRRVQATPGPGLARPRAGKTRRIGSGRPGGGSHTAPRDGGSRQPKRFRTG